MIAQYIAIGIATAFAGMGDTGGGGGAVFRHRCSQALDTPKLESLARLAHLSAKPANHDKYSSQHDLVGPCLISTANAATASG